MGGDDKQVTIMVLKVDLQCRRCYKKIKKVLCKFPQIQDQVYDEKANTVTIKVVCCCPDKIKQKIICKAGDTLKGIHIKLPDKPKPIEPQKPKEPEKPKDPPAKPKEPQKPKDPPAKPKEPEKPKDVPSKPKEPEKPKPAPAPAPVPVPIVVVPKPAPAPAPVTMVPKPAPAPAPAPAPVPIGYPPGGPYPMMRSCCPDCIDGRPGGPCYYGCAPPGPPPCYQYDGYYGRPVYDSYGGGRSYHVNRCDYFSEENTGACAIM